ncbi:MAG: isoprenylcysteine carboxylmethyltransferase family protein [Ruminococcaceae bacterium]|nr:isoprenylcysteine carboxylmethyltransferase family protein [Oscillospiraceae bacterium]
MHKAKLAVKTMLLVIVFFAIFALFIFLPAGTLVFWQGWVFYAVFFISTLFITVYFLIKDPQLIERRVKANETRKAQKLFQSISGVVFFVGLLIIPGLDYRFSWSSVPDFVVSVSNALVLLGFLVVFFVFKSNSYTSATIGVSQGQKVVSTGVYSVVRHPMYAGAILILIFMPLSLDSLWGLIPAFFISIFVVLRLLDEEKVLMNELDGYKEYCEKTRYHLIPYIW